MLQRNAMFTFAESICLLQPLACPPAIKLRVSLYVDDVVTFVSPIAQDVMLAREILATRGELHQMPSLPHMLLLKTY